ncbi:MAG: M50 family metallopeptidase [Chloroflexota bacterium]
MLNDNVADKPVRKERRRALVITGLAMVVVYILWNIPQLDILLYPLALFTTYVHEAGHAVAALLTGGEVVAFAVNFDGSGYITRRGGWDWLIGPAGYLGAALFGSVLFYLVNRFPRLTNPLAITIGVGMALFTIFVAYGNLLALILGVGFGMILMALGMRANPLITLLAMIILAVSTALEAFFDLRYLLFVTDANLMINGERVANDAVQFSQRVTPFISPSIIAITWAAIAVIMFSMALYYGAWKPLQREIDDTYDTIRGRH